LYLHYHRFLLVLLRCFRIHSPNLPCPLYKDGSDCCEKLFSQLGGFGAAATLARTYTTEDAQLALPKFLRMETFTVDDEAALLFARHAKQTTVWEKDLLEGEVPVAAADLSVYPR
jgi:hypothetical protein